MKAKGPAAAKAEVDKKKGLALFGPKPPTPKMLRAFGGKDFLKKLKVTTFTFLSVCGNMKAFAVMLNIPYFVFPPPQAAAAAGGQ